MKLTLFSYLIAFISKFRWFCKHQLLSICHISECNVLVILELKYVLWPCQQCELRHMICFLRDCNTGKFALIGKIGECLFCQVSCKDSLNGDKSYPFNELNWIIQSQFFNLSFLLLWLFLLSLAPCSFFWESVWFLTVSLTVSVSIFEFVSF